MSGVYCTDGNLCLAGCSSDKRKCENVKPLSLWEIVELQTELAQAKEQLAAKDADLLLERDRLESVLIRNGFVRCDIAACNCGSWHARFGLKERFEEIIDTLAEAGHPLCNENGHIVLTALKELVAEQDAAKAQVKMLVEALERLLNHYCKSTLDGAIDAVDNAREVCADSYALAKIKEEG